MENSAKDSRDIVTFLYDWGLLIVVFPYRNVRINE